MPYADKNKQKEYMKLLMRSRRHSKIAVLDKTIVEQLKEGVCDGTIKR